MASTETGLILSVKMIQDATAWGDDITNYITDVTDGQEEPDYMTDRIYAGPHLCHKLECNFLAIDGNLEIIEIIEMIFQKEL